MADANPIEQDRFNNFGILRLVFATCVVISHSAELIDGNDAREPLKSIFGTVTLSALAVDGFFLVSGYLITRSFVRSSLTRYSIKRFFRIFPGYFVCFVLCFFGLATLVGGHDQYGFHGLVKAAMLVLSLSAPESTGSFTGMHYPALDGPMWTIAYEARCYIAAALLGLVGALTKTGRYAVLALSVAGLTSMAVIGLPTFAQISFGRAAHWLGQPGQGVRLTSAFFVGASFYLFNSLIKLDKRAASIAALALVLCLLSERFAEIGWDLFGGYLIFWIAFRVKVNLISKAVNKSDISYGLYLYAWPVQSAMIWFYRCSDPFILTLASLPAAGLLGYLSWALVEKPALQLASNISRRTALQDYPTGLI